MAMIIKMTGLFSLQQFIEGCIPNSGTSFFSTWQTDQSPINLAPAVYSKFAKISYLPQCSEQRSSFLPLTGFKNALVCSTICSSFPYETTNHLPCQLGMYHWITFLILRNTRLLLACLPFLHLLSFKFSMIAYSTFTDRSKCPRSVVATS